MLVYDISPVPKPRMTRADKWKGRPCVLRYRAFADEVRIKIKGLPVPYHVVFVLPMPKSWSAAKRERMLMSPHRQRPDKDNLEKALLDALFDDDSVIDDGRVTKRWGERGEIWVSEIEPLGDPGPASLHGPSEVRSM